MNLRMELLGALAVGGAAFSVLVMKSSIDSTLAGLCIVQSLQMCALLGLMLRSLSENEIKMADLERIREYIEDTPSEKTIQELQPPPNWPTEGKIQIRIELDNVIKGISLQINSGEKVIKNYQSHFVDRSRWKNWLWQIYFTFRIFTDNRTS